MQRLELGGTDTLHRLEETINKLSKAMLSTKEPSNNNWREGSSHSYREENDGGKGSFLFQNGKVRIFEILRR
ncbi:hypothetical protein Pint_12958 [Pistacia integerrima]|uniref:Uncharacterized protein n=1 Tax=Pistacia integerrima TaxID=434235 RepID=A0ACC0YA21_9ROSI|nr:hypothetical protein Pint_12958 [Pistacia integerrima]